MSQIVLRELELGDVAQLNVWRNDKTLLDKLGNNFRYIAKDVDIEWYKHYLQNRDKCIRLAIIFAATQQYIGNVNLTDIHATNASAEFSIWIGEQDFHAKGIGTQATQLMLAHGFNNLNLHRIYLTVLQENKVAIRMYQKLGFKTDGTHRQAVFKNGVYHDLLAMSLLKHEYQQQD